MDIEYQKSLALKFCMDIANDYSKDEVEKFAPKSVQKAWQIGMETITFEVSKDRMKLKSFKL